ncbi:MAG: patatin-like phospholipase family protein [Dehalococcoidia bacterium]
MKRALVLGGGGNVGIAWEIAVLASLLEGGLDTRDADLIVGTSAGSVVGTHVAHGRDLRELLSRQREEPARSLPGSGPDMSALTAIFTTWAQSEEMTPERCAEVGRMALAAKTMPEDDWLAGFAANEWPGWPETPLIVTAVDCESGELLAIDRASGVPIERACAASCAVPGMFPPVTIDGRRYTDGGVRSGTSADLVQRIEPDRVLIVAPLGVSGRGVSRIMAKQLAREMGELQGVGATVKLVQPQPDMMAAVGENFMDPSKRGEAADFGQAQGAVLAGELSSWWAGR